VASILNWSNAQTMGQQARQVEAAANEVYPYGEEKYNKYRTFAMAHFEKHNIPIDIPSYSLCGERLGTAILTEESPAEFEERFSILETPFASIRKHLRSPDLSNVVTTTTTKTNINNTMPAKTIRSAFMTTLFKTHDIADLIMTPAFSQMACYGKGQALQVTSIALKDKSKAMSIPRNSPSFWAYLEFLTNTSIDMDQDVLASYEEFCKQWEKIDEEMCHTKSTKWQKNLYYLLAKDSRFRFSALQEWATDKPLPDSMEGKVVGHHHACVKCGELYYHAHSLKHVMHKQFDNQCTNSDCEWYQGDKPDPRKVISYPSFNNSLDEMRDARKALLELNKMDLEFAVINIVRGVLTDHSELLCKANLSKPIVSWYRFGTLGKEEKYMNKLIAKLGLTPQVKEKFEVILPGFIAKSGAESWDRLEAGETGETSLPMANGPATGVVPKAGSTAGATGHAAVDPTVNQTAASGAEVSQPAAVGTGSALGETVLTTFGGLPTEFLQMGGFVNSLLAYAYNPVALNTIPISSDTLEFAVLYSWDINPFSMDCVGPYAHAWASLHQRFAGSFNVGIQVASTTAIVGKLGIYHLPTGTSLPKNITRANMEVFDKVIIDLAMPSSDQLLVRPSNNKWFYIDRKNQYEDWGKIVVIAYTRISNTLGGSTSPPIYPTICLGEDAVYTLPILSEASDIPFDIPPVPPMGTFMYTEGHNVDPLYFPNDKKANFTDDGALRPDWMTTSGRVRAEPSNVKYENIMNFYWGRRFPEGDTYAGEQHAIGFANSNPNRYALDFALKDGKTAFDGLHSIAPEAKIGKTYNKQNNEGIGGTDQYAQVFPEELKIETISYIAADFEVQQEPGTAPWFGAFQNQDEETPTEVNIVQYSDSPASLRVRLVTREGKLPRTKFFEIRAEGLGLQSAANIEAPTAESLHNPARYETGPEVPSTEFKRQIPDISLLKAVVCNSSLPTTGQNVPPGFRLLLFWDNEDKDNWVGLPAVMPGIQGITTAMSAKQQEFKDQVRAFLDRTRSMSYVLRATSAASSMGLDILVNQYGAFVYDPDMEYGVIPTKTDYFYMRYLSSDRSREWITLDRPTTGLFASRISVTRRHAGFLLDDGQPKVATMENQPLGDSLDGGAGTMAAGVIGGLFSGVGQGLSAWTDREFQREMMRTKFAQDKVMQQRSLSTQAMMNARTNQAREYAAKHAADAQEWSADRAAKAQVEVANLRVIGGNNVATTFG